MTPAQKEAQAKATAARKAMQDALAQDITDPAALLVAGSNAAGGGTDGEAIAKAVWRAYFSITRAN